MHLSKDLKEWESGPSGEALSRPREKPAPRADIRHRWQGTCLMSSPDPSAERVIRYLTLTTAPEEVLSSHSPCRRENWAAERQGHLRKERGVGWGGSGPETRLCAVIPLTRWGSHLRKQRSQDLTHPPWQAVFYSTSGHLKPRGDGRTCTRGKSKWQTRGPSGSTRPSRASGAPGERDERPLLRLSPLSARHPLLLIHHVTDIQGSPWDVVQMSSIPHNSLQN